MLSTIFFLGVFVRLILTSPAPFYGEEHHLHALIQDSYTVKLTKSHTLDDHWRAIGRNLSDISNSFEYHSFLHWYHIRTDEHTIHELVRHDPGIEWVEQDRVVHKHLDWDIKTNNSEWPDRNPSDLIKRYYEYNENFFWSVGQINSWAQRTDIRDASPNTDWFRAKVVRTEGLGVNVYIVDNGVDIDEGRLNTCHDNQFEPKGGCARNFWRYYGPDHDNPYKAVGRHGTGVANCVIHTAMWATIVNVKVYNATLSETATAIGDIASEHRDNKKSNSPDWRGSVINMSWGFSREFHSQQLQDALAVAFDEGISLVTSAGNNGVINEQNIGTAPCGYHDKIVCVGASTKHYVRADFSHYDRDVTLFAPGENIWIGKDGFDPENYNSGTSFASPHVAGVMAFHTGWERIIDDAAKVHDRLVSNWQTDILMDLPDRLAKPNVFVHSGQQHPGKSIGQPYRDAVGPASEEPENPDLILPLVLIGDPTGHAPEQGKPVVDEPQHFEDQSEGIGYQAGTCMFHLIHREKCNEGYSATIEVKGNDGKTIDMGISPEEGFKLPNSEVQKFRKALPLELSVTGFDQRGALTFDYGEQHWNKETPQFTGIPGESTATTYCETKTWIPADYNTEPDVCKLEQGERIEAMDCFFHCD